MTALFVGPDERKALAALRDLAVANPVEVRGLMKRIKTPDGKAAHMRQMGAQSLVLPVAFIVTFSIETGHPVGVCRHMSISVPHAERVPHPAAAWMVAEALGFEGGLESCTVWPEDLAQGKAVNIVQPVTLTAGARA
jgi:hypothetical protein